MDRNLLAVLLLACALLLTACVEEGDRWSESAEPLAYDGRFIGKGYVRMSSEDIPGESLVCSGDCVYSVQSKFFYEGKGIERESIWDQVEDYDQFEVRTIIWEQIIEGTEFSKAKQVTETIGYSVGAAVGGNGDIWLLLATSGTCLGIEDEKTLVRIGREGKEVFRRSLDADIQPLKLAVDGKGNAAVLSSDGLYFFNPKGRSAGNMKPSGQSLDLCGDRKEGFYLIGFGGDGTALKKILDGKEELITAEYYNFYELRQADAGNILVRNESKVFLYSTADNSWRELFSWTDADVYPGDIAGWWMDAQGKIRCVVQGDNDTEKFLVTLEQSSGEEEEKEILKLGVWNASDDQMRKVVGFNRENNRYRVIIVDYGDKISGHSTQEDVSAANERLKLDLSSGNSLDLISTSVTDIGVLAEEGMIEDLGPYLDKSRVLSREDYFDEVLLSAAKDGILTYLPDSFTISTVLGKASFLGERKYWTVEEMLRLAEEYPGAYLFPPNDRGRNSGMPAKVLNAALLRNPDYFTEAENGMSGHGSETLVKLLERAKEEDENSGNISYADLEEACRGDEVLVLEAGITDFTDLTYYHRTYFGKERIQAIGYPVEEGNQGHVIRPRGGVCMLSSSTKKEAAWAFLEYCSAHADEKNPHQFPVKRKSYERQMKDTLEYFEMQFEKGEINYSISEDLALLEEILQSSIGDYSLMEDEVLKIVHEEAQSFYSGSKTAESAVEIIQSRVNLYISENAR